MNNQKKIIITGANGGIGKETSVSFLKKGYKVIAVDIKSHFEDEDLGINENKDFEYLQLNLLDEVQVKETVKYIVEQYGKIDCLFNIAGGSGRRFGDGPIHECTEEGFDKTIELNVKTQFFINKHVTREMIKQGEGNIINLTSVLGMVGGGEHFATHAYAASKAAIIGMTKAMAVQYAENNIRVNAIAPGLIETPMSKRAQSNEEILDYMDFMQPIYASKHTLGQPKSIAKAAEFLASDEADFITGIVIPVDGGWTAR